MDNKKISFGFSKVTKRSNLLTSNKDKEKPEKKIELIKCLEGQEIKLVEERKMDAPMVIPLKENTKTSTALASLMKRRAIILGESDEPPSEEQPCQINKSIINQSQVNETLEQRAARELLASVRSNDNETIDQNLVLPALRADELALDGAKQSTIDDYDNVPIEQFGKAMLRGMGWSEPIQKKGEPADEMPFVRPKGMGLGADKALKKQPLLVAPEKNEVLEIKKQAYVRILGGKHKDMYGQIEGFDDHAGRVIVKMAIGGGKEAFNEFLCQPVSKKEYAQYGKCINTAKYEEYKKMENEHGQIIIKKDDKNHATIKYEIKDGFKKEDDNKHRYGNRDGYRRDEILNNYHKSEGSTQKNKYENDRERFYQQSSSRRQQIDDRSFYHSSGNRGEEDRRRGGYRDSSARHYEQDEQRSSDSRHDRYDDRRKDRDTTKRISKELSSRNGYEERIPSSSSHSSRQQYTDNTSASSGTDSDSDSAYERKLKKKSSHKSKSKKKSSKKSKRKQSHKTTDTETSSNSGRGDDDYRRETLHKKSKKSKKPRSRSRSHDRTSRR